MTLTEARERVGQKVIYRPPHVDHDRQGEEGVVTTVGDTFVYVRFGTDTYSKATWAGSLEAVTQ